MYYILKINWTFIYFKICLTLFLSIHMTSYSYAEEGTAVIVVTLVQVSSFEFSLTEIILFIHN